MKFFFLCYQFLKSSPFYQNQDTNTNIEIRCIYSWYAVIQIQINLCVMKSALNCVILNISVTNNWNLKYREVFFATFQSFFKFIWSRQNFLHAHCLIDFKWMITTCLSFLRLVWNQFLNFKISKFLWGLNPLKHHLLLINSLSLNKIIN